MEILKYIEKISEINMSSNDKQRIINVSEVYHLWNHLMQRYNVMYITNLLNSSVQDSDFKLVINHGSKILMKHI